MEAVRSQRLAQHRLSGSEPVVGERESKLSFCVMAGLIPAIHVFLPNRCEDVDARLKAGHDDGFVLRIKTSASRYLLVFL
jgi:hypothetical protein